MGRGGNFAPFFNINKEVRKSMADNTIDTLELQVVSNASKASASLDALANKLSQVNRTFSALSGGGLRKYAKEVGTLGSALKSFSGIKIKMPQIEGATKEVNRLTKQLKEASKIDVSNLSNIGQSLAEVGVGLKMLDGIQNITIPELNTKSLNNVAKTLAKFDTLDTSKLEPLSQGLSGISSSMETLNAVDFKDKKITNVIGALQRLAQADLSGFDTGKLMQVMATLTAFADFPDVSSSFNRFVSSLARLANAGSSIKTVETQLPQLGAALKATMTDMANAGTVSDSVNSFISSIAKLASAGNKIGDSASGIPKLTEEVLKFLKAMAKAPQISANTVAMTKALAQLASAGGKVGTATTTVTTAFNKIASIGSKAANVVKKVASKIVSAFSKIGSASGNLNKASLGFGGLLKSALPYLSAYQLLNLGKQAVELSSDLTEVQNVVDTTFGDMTSKVTELASNSIEQFGMSELALKQYASRFQAMGSAMGIDSGSISSANKYLSTVTDGYVGLSDSMSDVSLNLTKLAADMASFYNVEQSVVAEDLASIFTGQTRPLRDYGLDLTQATLQEWALKQGLDADIESMTQAEKTMLRYQYVLANTTASHGDFARTADTWANQIRILKENFKALGTVIGGTFINALKPLVRALNSAMSAVTSFVKTVSDALGAIFGWTVETNPGGITTDLGDLVDADDYTSDLADSAGDAASGLGDAGTAAKNLKKSLSVLPFDQLNQLASNLDSTSSSGSGTGTGGSGSGSGDTGTGSSSTAGSTSLVRTDSLLEKYKSSIESLEQLGAYVGESLKKALDSINWDEVYKAAENFGTGLADFLNGVLRTPGLFDSIGKTIAGALNTALHAGLAFAETFDWTMLGKDLAEGLNSFFWNWDGNLTADTFSTFINGFFDTFVALFNWESGVQWSEIGTKLAATIKKALRQIKWRKAYEGAISFGTGLATFLNRLITPSTFAQIGSTIAGTLNTVISGAYGFLGTIEWKQWGDSIAEGANRFFDDFEWKTAGLTLNDLIGGFIETLKEFAERGNWEDWGAKIGSMLAQIEWWKHLKNVASIIITTLGGLIAGLESSGFPGKVVAFLTKAFLLVKVADITGIKWLAGKLVSYLAKKIGLTSNAKTIAEALKTVLSPAASEAASTLGKTGTAAETAGGGLKVFGSKIGALIGDGGLVPLLTVALVNGTREFAKFIEKLQGGNGKLTETGGYLHDFAAAMTNTNAITSEQAEELWEFIEAEEAAGKTNEEMYNSFIKKLEEYGVSTDQASEALKRYQTQSSVSSDFIESMTGKLDELGDGFSKNASGIDTSSITTKQAISGIRGALDELSVSNSEYSGTYRGILMALDDTIYSATSADDAFGMVYTALVNAGVPADELNTALAKAFPDAVGNVTSSASDASSSLGGLSGKLKDVSENASNAESKGGLLNTAFSNLNGTAGVLSSLGLLALSTLTKTYGSNAGKASDNTSSLDSGLSKLNTSSATNGIKKVNDAIKTLAENAGKSKDIGSDWTTGLANGIKDPLPTLRANVSSINTSIKTDTQDQLGEHSPSTIAHGYGQNWVQGFINGMNSLKNSLLTATGNLYTGVKGKFDTAQTDFHNIGTKMVSGLSGGLKQYSAVTSAASNIASAIKRSLNVSLYSTGQSMISSLARGMYSVRIKTPQMYLNTYASVGENGASYRWKSGIEWYKRGGLFDGASVIGVGEAGREAVLPLENQRTMSMIADSIMSNAKNAGIDEKALENAVTRGVAMAMMNQQGNQAPINLYATLYTEDNEVLARAVEKGMNNRNSRFQPSPAY